MISNGNKDNNNSVKYKAAIDNIKISEDFEEKTIDFIKTSKNNKNIFLRRKVPVLALAACFVLAILMIPSIMQKEIKLNQSSSNVKVRYINHAPKDFVACSLTYRLTEKQIFEDYSDVIFQGKVQDIQNISISFGYAKYYRAIATIQVEDIIRGNLQKGDIIRILMPCSIDEDVLVEDTRVISTLRKGSEGIFMPTEYDDTSIWSENGGTLYLKDICDYGFSDGERYAFVETEQGLVYSEWTFYIQPKPTSLKDIKDYIQSFLNSKTDGS